MFNLEVEVNKYEPTLEERIHQRRRQILVHSYLYYELNETIIDDFKFDSFCNELVELQEKYPEVCKRVPFHEDFIGFDGSSGFDLPYNQPTIVNAAIRLLNYRKKETKSVKVTVVDPNV